MVATIAGDAGIRAVPSRAELSAFCSRCRNATPHHLARALQERLQSAATWKAKSVRPNILFRRLTTQPNMTESNACDCCSA